VSKAARFCSYSELGSLYGRRIPKRNLLDDTPMTAKKIAYPKGYHPRPGVTKIAIPFPDGLFKEIMIMAKRENKQFSAMVIELCTVGKLDLDETDALGRPRKAKFVFRDTGFGTRCSRSRCATAASTPT
jgi:hypothetical protein